jgi:hypothetical protein
MSFLLNMKRYANVKPGGISAGKSTVYRSFMAINGIHIGTLSAQSIERPFSVQSRPSTSRAIL